MHAHRGEESPRSRGLVLVGITTDKSAWRRPTSGWCVIRALLYSDRISGCPNAIGAGRLRWWRTHRFPAMRSLRLSSSAAVAREHPFWMSFLKGRTNPDGRRRTEVDSRPRLPVRDPEGRLQRRSARITHQPEVGRRHDDLAVLIRPHSQVNVLSESGHQSEPLLRCQYRQTSPPRWPMSQPPRLLMWLAQTAQHRATTPPPCTSRGCDAPA